MKRAILAVVTVLVGIAVVGGTILLTHRQQREPDRLTATIVGTASTPQGVLPHATLELSIYPENTPAIPGPSSGDDAAIESIVGQDGWPFYWPSTSLELPAHSLVTITLHQYDGSSTVWNPYFAKVHGTVGGTATYNGETKTEIKPEDVAHTFTIHQYPESTQPAFFVSVPMLAVPNNAKNEANGYPKPVDITFSFITGEPGEYVWNCEDPCGSGYKDFGGVMSMRGWMSGTVKVV